MQKHMKHLVMDIFDEYELEIWFFYSRKIVEDDEYHNW